MAVSRLRGLSLYRISTHLRNRDVGSNRLVSAPFPIRFGVGTWLRIALNRTGRISLILIAFIRGASAVEPILQ